MSNHLWELPHDLRNRLATTLRQQHLSLTEDISAALGNMAGFEATSTRQFSSLLVHLFAAATEAGSLDQRRSVLHDFAHAAAPMRIRQVIHGIHRAERIVLDELAIDDGLRATEQERAMAAHIIRSAAFEIAAVYSERDSGMVLRDPLTTLMSEHVFRFALDHETERSNRYGRSLAMLVFDLDNLSEVNKSQGYGAGNRLLERLGISARGFFRTHDWVARHRDDAIVVLLPETALDQATALANRFREMVQHRLRLVDHKTDSTLRVTVSAAVVGTDLLQAGIDGARMIAEAEAAVVRAKMEGGNRTETVALLPTTLTIIGAATLLDTTPREVVRLIRRGALHGARRGRHIHIDRTHIEEYRRTRERAV